VNATVAQARRKARVSPQLGRFIATLDIDTPDRLVFERTTSGPGHWTIWGRPEDLLKAVVSVIAANEIQ
jgi:hypothetical protein